MDGQGGQNEDPEKDSGSDDRSPDLDGRSSVTEPEYEVLFKHAPDGIIVHDAEGHILDTNEATLETLGYTREELLSMEVPEIEVGLDEEALREKWHSLDTDSMQRLEDEGIHRRKDGTTFPVEVWVSKVESEGTDRFIALARDITERKENERQIERREEKYRTLFEKSRDALMLLDREGFFDCNETTLELFGLDSVEEFTNYTPGELAPPTQPDGTDSETAATEHIEQAFEDGAESFDWVHKRADGTDFQAEVNLSRIEFDGEPVLQALVRDVTEHKEAKQRLEQFEKAIEQTAHAVYITDVDGTIEYVNPAFETITGYSEAEAVGKTPTLLQSGEQDEEFYEELWETIRSGEQWHGEITDEHNHGQQIVLDQTISPLTDDDGNVEKFVAVARDITERKQHERELKRYRIYVESANDVITLIDPDGTVKYVSPAVERVYGWEPEELIGEHGFEYVHPDDRDEQRENMEALIEREDGETRVEFRSQCADGSYCWSEATVQDLLDDPDIEGFLLSGRDITDRKKHEQQLSSLHSSTRDLINADSKSEVAEIAAKTANDLLEFSLPSVWYPTDDGSELVMVADSEKHSDLLEEAGTPEPAHPQDSWFWDIFEEGETVVRSPISREELAADVPLQSAIILPLGDHGILACAARGEVEFTGRQISVAEILARNVRVALDQLDQRAALERQKEFTDDLLDAIDDVVYVLNTDGNLQEWNVALEEVSGYASEEIESMNAVDFFNEEDAKTAASALEEAFETGRNRVELDLLTADGESIPYELLANAFEGPDGESLVAGIGRDRSRHVEYEQKLEEQRDNLETLNQVVRHDIRNDMTVVRGRANLLEEHVEEEDRENLEMILEATKNAIELTKTARDLSETMLTTEDDIEPVMLAPHLRTPIENARSTYENAIITIDDRIPDVRVQGNELLKSVFRNIIQNAIVHNDKEAPGVHVSTTIDEETATVSIADNGPGISDDRKETIFGKSEKSLDSPGTGLGLYLVRTLVEQYGGDVWVEDNDPEGSVFYVELPRADTEGRQ